MICFLASMAFAGKWTGKPSDVVSERTFQAPPSAVYSALNDLSALGAAWSEPCVSEWVVSEDRVTVRYTIGVVRRRVPAVLANPIPGLSIDLEHEGKRGFTTRFALAAVGDSTQVVMTTFLAAPPWPVRGAYFTKVKPAWEACQAAMLSNLVPRVEAP